MRLDKLFNIGSRIKQLRINQGWTQKEFADYVGIPYSTYSNYENNNRKPSIERIEKIADALNTTPSYLYGMDPALEALLQKADRENPDIAEQFKEATVFENYLESIGYKITMNYDEIKEFHYEEYGKVVDDATYLTILEKDGKTITLTETEYAEFKKELENSVNYQFWKKLNNL